MCSWYEMLAIAFNLKSGLSTSEKRLNFESTLQPTKVYHVILRSRDRYLASQKNINSIGPFNFLIPLSIPLLYIVCEGKNIDNGGVPVRGEGEQGERAKKTDGLDQMKPLFMWLNILSLQWSVKQISWNSTSEHSMYIMMHSWTWQWWFFFFFLVTFCYKLTPKNMCLSRIHK